MNRAYIVSFLVISVGFFNVGCGAKFSDVEKKTPPLAAGYGRIYFYHDSHWEEVACIEVDHKPIRHLSNNNYCYIDRPAGNYLVCCRQISLIHDEKFLHLALEDGDVRYVRTVIRTNLIWYDATPVLEDKALATPVLEKCTYAKRQWLDGTDENDMHEWEK